MSQEELAGGSSKRLLWVSLNEIPVELILKSKCYPCHSHAARTTEGGLTLDSRNGWEKGGDSGPAIEPGKPERSLLVRAIRGADPETKMPPDETLSSKEIKIIEQWMQIGGHSKTSGVPKSRVKVTPSMRSSHRNIVKRVSSPPAPQIPQPWFAEPTWIYMDFTQQDNKFWNS